MRTFAKLAKGDAVVWFAYPKGSSKRYKSEVNRDDSWASVGQEGFEPVRMVAIDEDWSALRVRRVDPARDPRGELFGVRNRERRSAGGRRHERRAQCEGQHSLHLPAPIDAS